MPYCTYSIKHYTVFSTGYMAHKSAYCIIFVLSLHVFQNIVLTTGTFLLGYAHASSVLFYCSQYEQCLW